MKELPKGFDYEQVDIESAVDPRPKVIGLSDPLSAPTGFGRVSRELFTRLSATNRYKLAYLARGWPGSSKFPGVTCYSDGNRPGFCQEALPATAIDFAGLNQPFILWSLLDPWQVGWIALPDTSPHRRPSSMAFFKHYREKMFWIGHFPIDGLGPQGGPALWTEQYIEPMDMPIAMSEWGRKILQPLVKKEIRFISHAIDTSIFCPGPKDEARMHVEASYAMGVARGLQRLPEGERPQSNADFAEEVQRRTFRVRGHFTVLCVMANRPRKYWWEVLLAFRKVLEEIPSARLIAVCGDRQGTESDSWPIEDQCQMLGLRVDYKHDDPNVWLIDVVSGQNDDVSLAMLYRAADVSILLSGGEGFGLPQLEAHACGTPVIAGDYSASTELAVNGRELITPRGFTFSTVNMVKRPVYSPKDLADRLVYAYENPSWRKETGLAGVEQAKARDWAVILPSWVEVLDEAARRLGMMTVQEDLHAQAAVPQATSP